MTPTDRLTLPREKPDTEILSQAALILTRGYPTGSYERLLEAMMRVADGPQLRPMCALGETCLSIYAQAIRRLPQS